MPALTLAHRRIAILEDDPTNRERLADKISDCGGDALPVSGPAPELSKLKSFCATNKVNLVVCDHHLTERSNYASYYGAEAVARSYQNGIAGILVTAYDRVDAEISLRRFRRFIPALLHSPTEVTSAKLLAALFQAEQEVLHKKPIRGRIGHRTIMTVQEIETRGVAKDKAVKVLMSQWSVEQSVVFPMDRIPSKFHSEVKPGRLLIAQVNIEASKQEELFFENFELPNQDALKKAQSLFGRA
jgi:CheY-like chemotaxis protein